MQVEDVDGGKLHILLEFLDFSLGFANRIRQISIPFLLLDDPSRQDVPFVLQDPQICVFSFLLRF